MDQHCIECVLATARNGSFTQAAVELESSPQHIRDMVDAAEGELRVRLFERTSKGCVPTVAGETFAQQGASVLRTLQSFCSSVANAEANCRDVLVQCWANREIPVVDTICNTFTDRYPAYGIRLVPTNASTMVSDIESGYADIGFFSRAATQGLSEKLERHVFTHFKLGYRCLMKRDDRLAERASLRQEDLAGKRVYLCSEMLPPEVDGSVIDGLIPTDRWEVYNCCSEGGVCLVDNHFTAQFPYLVSVPVEDLHQQTCCLYRKNPPERVRLFVEVADEVIEGGCQ